MSQERVVIDPKVMFGKPAIRGTRVTLEQILRKLAAGETPEDIRRDHPRVTLEDIRAAQAFCGEATTGMDRQGS